MGNDSENNHDDQEETSDQPAELEETVTVGVVLFRPSGRFWSEEEWEVPGSAIGPQGMVRSKDFHTFGGGPVLVKLPNPWDKPHLLNLDKSRG